MQGRSAAVFLPDALPEGVRNLFEAAIGEPGEAPPAHPVARRAIFRCARVRSKVTHSFNPGTADPLGGQPPPEVETC